MSSYDLTLSETLDVASDDSVFAVKRCQAESTLAVNLLSDVFTRHPAIIQQLIAFTESTFVSTDYEYIQKANVYCSLPDGSDLYYVGTGRLGTEFVIDDVSLAINPLRSMGLDKAPLGQLVKFYKGRLFVAQDNIVWYSEPFQYDFFRLDESYFELPEPITALMPVDNGLWLGSDALYFIAGTAPDSFQLIKKDTVIVVKGTPVKINGGLLAEKTAGYVWWVTTSEGVFQLGNDGQASNITAKKVDMDITVSGSGLLLQHDGLNQYLSMMKDREINNTVFGDFVTATVIRNGVAIS